MKIIRSMGGLGNQLFQYALYLQLSKSGQAFLDLAWHARPGTVPFQLDQFSVAYSRPSKADVSRLSDTGASIVSRIRRRYFRKRTHLRERQDRFNDEVFRLPDGVECYLDGYWQSPLYFPDVVSVIRDAVFPPVLRQVAAEELKRRVGNRTTVFVHVRRGDYLSSSALSPLPGQYYRDAMTRVRERLECPSFVVFSDEMSYASTLFARNEVILADWNSSAVEDLYAMASCDHAIVANSSFSWWAAFLLPRVDKLVLFPRAWFKKIRPESTRFMFPGEWTGL